MFEIVQENVKVCTTGMSSRTLYAHHPVSLNILTSLPGYRLRFFIKMQIQYSYYTSTSLYSGINTLYAQNPVFEIVHDESVKAYLHIHVQRECPAEPSMRRSLWKWGIFHLSSVLAIDFLSRCKFSALTSIPFLYNISIDSMRRKPCVRNCSWWERWSIYT